MTEKEVRIRKPKRADMDLIFDPSMLGRYRMEQIRRWQEEPGFFLCRDINAMCQDNVLKRRREEVMRRMIESMKEGTDDRGADAEEEDHL